MVESFVVRFVKMFAIEVGFAARLVIKVVFTTYCSSCQIFRLTISQFCFLFKAQVAITSTKVERCSKVEEASSISTFVAEATLIAYLSVLISIE